MPGNERRSWKIREKRQRTVLPARLRDGQRWSEACILNISSHGLLIHSDCRLDPGSNIVVRRGQQTVIARVVWRSNRRIGLSSVHPISIEALASNDGPDAPLPTIPAPEKGGRQTVRRAAHRSRARARAMEFLALVIAGMLFAGAVGACALSTLGRPLQAVQATLEVR